MSSLDRWLTPYVQADGAATSATAATQEDTRWKNNATSVSPAMRQAATPHTVLAIVAERRTVPANEKHQQSQAVNANVASVANVAALFAEWDATDWQEFYDERVGHITEGDDKKLVQAKQQALRECVSRWLARNPDPHADPDTCPQCGAPSGVTAALPSTLFLIPGAWPLAIHDACVPAWCERRRQEAMAALAEMGLKWEVT